MYEKTSCAGPGTELDGFKCCDGTVCASQDEQDWYLPCAWNHLLQPNQALRSLQVAARLFEGWWKDAKEMKKLLLLGFFLLSASSTFANNKWSFVFQDSFNNQFFIDINSLKKSGDSVTFWRRVNFYERGPDGGLSSKMQSTINCRARDWVNRHVMIYDDLNNNGLLVSELRPDSKWTSITPGSIIWEHYHIVCRG
jgi:hypothetical protein